MRKKLFRYRSDNLNCWHIVDETPKNNCAMHTHDHYEIYYFVSGECSYLVEGTLYSLKPGDIMIMRPLEAHKCIVNSTSTPYERIVINISVDFLSKIDSDDNILSVMMNRPLGTSNKFTLQDFGHNLCNDCYASIILEPEKISRIDIISRALLILSEVKNVIEKNNKVIRTSDIGSKLIDYINNNLYNQLSLESISNEFFMSQSQINRIFRKKTGSSVGQYISTKRLITARNKIRAGHTATEACNECGYNDYSAFYRAYVKHFGVSPHKDK